MRECRLGFRKVRWVVKIKVDEAAGLTQVSLGAVGGKDAGGRKGVQVSLLQLVRAFVLGS